MFSPWSWPAVLTERKTSSQLRSIIFSMEDVFSWFSHDDLTFLKCFENLSLLCIVYNVYPAMCIVCLLYSLHPWTNNNNMPVCQLRYWGKLGLLSFCESLGSLKIFWRYRILKFPATNLLWFPLWMYYFHVDAQSAELYVILCKFVFSCEWDEIIYKVTRYSHN